jgi:hypothetical protein
MAPRLSSRVCSLMAALVERNGAHGYTDRHRSMVREHEHDLMHESPRRKSAKGPNSAPRRLNRDQTKSLVSPNQSLTYARPRENVGTPLTRNSRTLAASRTGDWAPQRVVVSPAQAPVGVRRVLEPDRMAANEIHLTLASRENASLECLHSGSMPFQPSSPGRIDIF